MSNRPVPISNIFVHLAFDNSSGASDQSHELSDARFLYLPDGSSFEAKQVLTVKGMAYKKRQIPPGFLRQLSNDKFEAAYRVFEEECAPPTAVGNAGPGDLWIDFRQKEIRYFWETWRIWEGIAQQLSHPIIRGHVLFPVRDGPEFVRWWSLSGGGKARKEMGDLSPSNIVTQALARRQARETAPAKKTYKQKNLSGEEINNMSSSTTLYRDASVQFDGIGSWSDQVDTDDLAFPVRYVRIQQFPSRDSNPSPSSHSLGNLAQTPSIATLEKSGRKNV